MTTATKAPRRRDWRAVIHALERKAANPACTAPERDALRAKAAELREKLTGDETRDVTIINEVVGMYPWLEAVVRPTRWKTVDERGPVGFVYCNVCNEESLDCPSQEGGPCIPHNLVAWVRDVFGQEEPEDPW